MSEHDIKHNVEDHSTSQVIIYLTNGSFEIPSKQNSTDVVASCHKRYMKLSDINISSQKYQNPLASYVINYLTNTKYKKPMSLKSSDIPAHTLRRLSLPFGHTISYAIDRTIQQASHNVAVVPANSFSSITQQSPPVEKIHLVLIVYQM